MNRRDLLKAVGLMGTLPFVNVLKLAEATQTIKEDRPYYKKFPIGTDGSVLYLPNEIVPLDSRVDIIRINTVYNFNEMFINPIIFPPKVEIEINYDNWCQQNFESMGDLREGSSYGLPAYTIKYFDTKSNIHAEIKGCRLASQTLKV